MYDQIQIAATSLKAFEALEFNCTLYKVDSEAIENCLALAAVVGISMLMGAVGTLEETLICRKELVVV